VQAHDRPERLGDIAALCTVSVNLSTRNLDGARVADQMASFLNAPSRIT